MSQHKIYEGLPFEDRVIPITDEDRQNPDFAHVEQSIENLYSAIGAKVLYGISYAGEPVPPAAIDVPVHGTERAIRNFPA